MYATYPGMTGIATDERRENNRLRAVYEDAAEHLHHLFKAHDWVGSSIDYVALRLVHERYRDLSPKEIRLLVTAIGGRQRYCVSGNRLTALYP